MKDTTHYFLKQLVQRLDACRNPDAIPFVPIVGAEGGKGLVFGLHGLRFYLSVGFRNRRYSTFF